MDITEARKILRALAEGADPFTGEILDGEGLWANAKVVRALYLAVQQLEPPSNSEQKPATARTIPSAAGKPWPASEDSALRQSHSSGASVRDLAKLHGRTKGAIASRLRRLGLVVRQMPSGNNHAPDEEA